MQLSKTVISFLLVGWMAAKLLPATAAETKSIPRTIPPAGVELPAAERQQLRTAADQFAGRLTAAAGRLRRKEQQALLPDVEIFLKSVDYALENGEFFAPGEVKWAQEQLKAGDERLNQLLSGQPSWTKAKKLVVRGYRSQIDDSVQPLGLVIPESLNLAKPCPLYVWLHGRGDKMTELAFIRQRMNSPGELVPDDAIVLHPFGRYCNAFKFAGETDVFESIAAVERHYRIDPDRIVLAGFSMGGAGAWHLGAHYAERWTAVSPGAGFAETRRYVNLTPEKYPPAYEQTLWGLYDAPDYVRTLFNVPVIAYSGENDKQIQAARVMEEAYQQEGRQLTHLIGPGMGHKYHPDTLADLRKRLQQLAAKGRDRFPHELSLQTRTLRYSSYAWVQPRGLERHWQDSRVDAALGDDRQVKLTTKNVSALRLSLAWKDVQQFPAETRVEIDGQGIALPTGQPLGAELSFHRHDGKWAFTPKTAKADGLRKTPGLQGPIDDVFFEPFLVVTPGKQAAHPQIEQWMAGEQAHFIDRWRRLFRGDVRIKRDDQVSDEDLRKYHLIVWGDPQSNSLLAKCINRLPLTWNQKTLEFGGKTYDAAGHVPAMIYPNPLNPQRYLVLNSGPTFREAHDSTNSQQTPKLPDWAVIDLSQPPDNRQPGRIAAAGFFDEQWQLGQ
jgi:dienelactone hydrolase